MPNVSAQTLHTRFASRAYVQNKLLYSTTNDANCCPLAKEPKLRAKFMIDNTHYTDKILCNYQGTK